MKEVRYMISDAAKKINVEPHVLRYWEEELEVGIPRNEMGHRYYREEDIQMMQGVKYLKERGFQLKSIKILLPDAERVMQLPHRRLLELRDRLELAMSREELRLQREQELLNCVVKEEGEISQTSAEVKEVETLDVEELQGGDMAKKRKMDQKRDRSDNKKEMEGEARKAEGKVMEDGMDVQGARPGVLSAGQAARLVEIWQNGQPEKTDSDPEKECPSMPYESVEEEQETEVLSKQSENAAVVSDNAVRMQQFRGIMNEIVTDAMRENNRELTGSITASVSKEMEYHMRKREMMLEEHFKQLDRTLREYQLGQKQAAVARECGRRESRFFKKNGKVRI